MKLKTGTMGSSARARRLCRGTAYIEYLLAAAAAAAAASLLFGRVTSVRGVYEGRRDGWMNQIAGPVQVP